MRREQRRQSSRIASRHAAFCADAIDTGKAPGGGKPRLIPACVIVVDQTEVKLGLGAQLEI